MPGIHTIREHESFDRSELHPADYEELRSIANTSPILLRGRDSGVSAANYVGIITTKRGAVVEILPKIDLDAEDSELEDTKRVFLEMLRSWNWQRLREKQFPESSIRALQRFSMLEVFVRQFLDDLNTLARSGLAKRYVSVEENLPYLRGRLLFREHVRENLTNRARFYVSHDELSVNRPANRLIHSALARLTSLVQDQGNRRLLQLLRQMIAVADVPQSANLQADRQRYHVDRSMPHYGPVMQWVELFLFGYGLTTYSGRHRNLSLLFPMEQVFEDFVAHSFRRYQPDYGVTVQSHKAYLAEIGGRSAFQMRPDILLQEKNGEGARFILDAKWKRLDTSSDAPKYGIDQGDLYQLYAHAKGYDCKVVALVYPRAENFGTELKYRLLADVTLLCLPFDVARPDESVRHLMEVLTTARSSVQDGWG